MEVVHDIKYLQLKFGPNWSTFRGVTISFFLSYTKKILFFSKFRYQENFGQNNFFSEVFIRVYYRCMKISGPYFNFFLDYRLKKGLKLANFAIFGLTVFNKLLFDTQKMLSGS